MFTVSTDQLSELVVDSSSSRHWNNTGILLGLHEMMRRWKSWSLLVFVLTIIVRSEAGEEDDEPIYRSRTDDTIFNSVIPLNVAPQVEKAVWFIEEDRNRQGNCIIADGSALKVFNLESLNERTIVGDSNNESYIEGFHTEARFDMITGFAQVNRTHILIVDSNNHCIRYVDRRERTTSRYSGQCEMSGMREGAHLDAMFNQPKQIIILNRPQSGQSLVLITDFGNGKIRSFQLNRGIIETLVDMPQSPIAIATDRRKDWVYVTTISQVWRVKIDTRRVIHITQSSTPGFRDGSFETALFDFPTSIVSLGKDTLIVAEPGHNRLRVLNLRDEEVSSICNGDDDFTELDTSIRSCQINQPYSLTVRRATVIIGTNSSMMRILEFERDGPGPGRPGPRRTYPPFPPTPTSPATESTASGKKEHEPVSDSLVIIVTVVTVGVVVIAVVVAVAIVVYKRCAVRSQRKAAGPTEHLDMAVRNAAAQHQMREKTGDKPAVYHTISNPYSTYEEVEDPYQSLEDQKGPYYTQLKVENSAHPLSPSPRSLRYGPLPHRPTSDGIQQPSSDDYYCSAEHITVVDSDDEKPVEAFNSAEKKDDYNYLEFDQDNCSHEKVDTDEEKDEQKKE